MTQIVDMVERRAYYDALVSIAKARGYRVDWAAVRYHHLYGEWPPQAWQPEVSWIYVTSPKRGT